MNFLRNVSLAVLDFFFGCSHDAVTRPFTIARRTYKVCLDCGAELPYSVQTWSYVPKRARRAEPAVPVRTATILAFDAARVSREPGLRDKAAA
jgi:hypothetical protein